MNSSIAAELSATTYAICTSIDVFIQAISSIPQHPYEQMKYVLFEKDHKFPTLAEVKVPEVVDTKTLIKGFETCYECYQERVLDYLSTPDKFSIEQANNQMSALAELSSNNTYVVTPQRHRNYIEALELIQGIDINSINETNCNEIINKIGYTVLQVFQKKTV
jgi:hypothetical protein